MVAIVQENVPNGSLMCQGQFGKLTLSLYNMENLAFV